MGAATAALIILPFLASAPAQASAPTAATVSAQALLDAPMVSIGAAPSIPLGDRALGLVPATSAETAAIVVRPRSESALTKFIASVTSKDSATYHRYLTRGEFENRFGPTKGTIAEIEKALTAEGLRVANVSSDGLLVTFKGSAARVEQVFGVGLRQYRLPDGSLGQATIGAPHFSALVAPSVAGVVGLDELVRSQPADIRPHGSATEHGFPAAKAPAVPHVAGAPTPCTLAQQDAATSGGLTDDQIANAYGAFGLYDAGDFGAGQHMAVYELQPFLATDIETFDTCYFGAAESAAMSGTSGNLIGSRLSITPVDGGELQPGPGSENDEANLDIEDVSALAPAADIQVYEAPNTTFGGLDEYSVIVNSDVDQVVTSSWAVCEQLAQVAEPGLQQAENFLFEQAAAQGQTVLNAAGDTGDDSCNEFRAVPPPPGQNLLSLLDPASQPYVVSVGGTTIDDATQPPSEHVWDDGAAWGGGGGGVSETWEMPSWQRTLALSTANTDDVSNAEAVETATAASTAPFTTPTFCDGTLGVSGQPCRETPDVTAQADEFTGSITIYGQSLGYGNPDGWATIGGTSSATPIWAAMLALVNASSSCSGDLINGVQDTGFANPILYGIASSPAAYAASFNDITSGNNDIYGLDNGLVFPARSGYDMASGLGSPQLTTPSGGNALAYYMCQYGPTLAPPSVTSLSATSGSTVGGETVTVTGSGFGTSGSPLVSSVSVGAGQASSFSVTNNTTLSVVMPPADTTTPAGSPDPTEDGAGPVQIVVTNTSGRSSIPSANSVFEYVDKSGANTVPSVTGVSPYGGLDLGPVPVTVFGSGFAAGATVDFGGVAGSNVTVVSPFEITVAPPAFSALTPATACPVDNGAAHHPLNAVEDVCQVEVTVTVAGQTSTTATILPPYEGPLEFDNMGAEVLPTGCGCEDMPQTSEYDYVPLPTLTSVSTGTLADLPGSAASLASEYGGAATNTVTVSGTGLDPLTLSYATLGVPTNENSIFFPEQESGTSMVLLAPAVAPVGDATVQPIQIAVGATSIAGASTTTAAIVYAGVPEVTGAVNTGTGLDGVPDSQSCANPPPAGGCGTPVTLTGAGFNQSVGPIGFVDNFTGTSVGTQYSYTVNSDTSISSQSVQQNPDVVDVEVCSVTGCGFNPPSDFLFVYPPGNPVISSITAAQGPAHGGNDLVIKGSNLGCAISVSFGSVTTGDATNAEALLDCGQTGEVDVVAPAGAVGTVHVTIQTVESEFTGSSSNFVSYTYTKSAPSAPTAFTVVPLKGSAYVKWGAPAENGGDPVSSYIVTASSPGQARVVATLKSTQLSHLIPYLQPGVPWTFSVRAVSSLGNGVNAVSSTYTLAPGDNGYIEATANGGTSGFGSLSSRGGPGGGKLASPIVGIAATPDGLGYVEVASNGTTYNFGDAGNYGSATVKTGQRVVGIAATVDGAGYWVLLNTGAVQAFGDAVSHGSLASITDAVGIAATPDGGGYYIAQGDGKVSPFGDASFKGDQFGKSLPKPIVGIAVDPVGLGYWLVGGSGAVYNFGAASNFGSMVTERLTEGAVGMVAAPDGKGYWLLAPDAKVFHFGSAANAGDASGVAESAAVGIVSA